MWTFKYSHKMDSPQLKNNVEKLMENSVNQLLLKPEMGFQEESMIKKNIDLCSAHTDFYRGKRKLIILGLGGSCLGAQTLAQALYPHTWRDQLIFLDNVDSFHMDFILKKMSSPKEYGWVVISKSGQTLETLTLLDYIYEYMMRKHQLFITENMIVITENKKSLLREFAKTHSVPTLFLSPHTVGRFSVFTPVGLFPLFFLGLSLKKIQESLIFFLTNPKNLKKTILPLSTQLYKSIENKELHLYCFSYCERLSYWSQWFQQLWSESLGKSQNKKGEKTPIFSTPILCRGLSDQHSVLQQMSQNHFKKCVLFLRVQSSEKGPILKTSVTNQDSMVGKPLGALLGASASSTQNFLDERNARTLSLTTEDIGVESIVELMTLSMMVVGTLGEAYNMDTFNQPDVERGKKITFQILGEGSMIENMKLKTSSHQSKVQI